MAVWLHEMTRPAFEEYLRAEPKPVALLPLGAIEQHGPHLPLGMDILAARHLTELTARKANAFGVLTTLAAYSPHHMGFKGTITLRAETLAAYLDDVIGSLARHGVRRIMILNAHGGNEEIAAQVARTAASRHGVMVAKPRTRAAAPAPEATADLDIHAGRSETAAMLAVAPELVEGWRLEGYAPAEALPADVRELLDEKRPDAFLAQQVAMLHLYLHDTHEHTTSGVFGYRDPREATAADGQRHFEALSAEYAEFIRIWRTVRLAGEEWRRIPFGGAPHGPAEAAAVAAGSRRRHFRLRRPARAHLQALDHLTGVRRGPPCVGLVPGLARRAAGR
ncbi:MAG TPA: creatininase family protein [Bacillota bacterium]|nr:creatininase family protein [Bacillota bacterium]